MSTQHDVRGQRPQPAGEDIRRRVLDGLPVSDRRLRLTGLPTAVLQGGEGAPVVLLHGPGEFGATWASVLPDLVRTHRVVVPDLPGHGASKVDERPLDRDRLLVWLAELIEQTCPSPPALVGHLLGGALAARFAANRPDRITQLVLVDTYGLAPPRPTPGFAIAMIGFLARPTERSQDRLFRQCFADFDGLRRDMGPRWEPLRAYALDRARTPGMKAALRTLMPQLGMPAIPPADLARITVPTTLIWGRHDRQVPLRVAESASARHGWPLHMIEHAADDPAVEQPAAFLAALRAALASAGPRTPGPRTPKAAEEATPR